MVGLLVFRNLLHGSSVIVFCDNMGVIHQAVNGTASEPDAKLLAHCFNLHAHTLELKVWLEYVNTLSNLADGGSRIGISCEMAARLGIPLRFIACPKLHDNFPRPDLQTNAVRLA
jgi:hypothetical protein